MALSLRYAVRSDLGLVRGNNEDSVYAGPRLLAIADGMGGHAAGEVASKIVISTLETLDEDRPIGDLMAELRDAVAESNHRLEEAVQLKPDLGGMGTTLTALRFVGSSVGLVHVGDSRAYLLRDDALSQITHDDTYVQFLVDSGKITADEAKDHPRKSVILRALRGTEVDPDVSIREARAGDRYLLCTDGLSDVVSTETIIETLRIREPQDSADRLVELALRGGGPDNVTVIVADVVEARVGDAVDDVPVIAGAFVDPSGADIPGTDSPAERAAHIGRPTPRIQPDLSAQQVRRGWRRWRRWVLAAVLVLVVAGGLIGTYAWSQTQFFVGQSGGEVVIYRGVNTAFGPIKLYEVEHSTGLSLNDLEPSIRSQISSGINAQSDADARDIVTRLTNDHLLPVCVAGSTTAVPGQNCRPA
jgi:protein phosphatase